VVYKLGRKARKCEVIVHRRASPWQCLPAAVTATPFMDYQHVRPSERLALYRMQSNFKFFGTVQSIFITTLAIQHALKDYI